MKIKEPILQDYKDDISSLKSTKELKKKTPIARFLWKDKKEGIVDFVSDNIVDVTAYTSQDFNSQTISYINIIYSDDLDLFLQEIEENNKNKTDSFEHQSYRIINKFGEQRWIKDITTIIRDKRGNIKSCQSLLIDITQQKELLEELVQTNKKYISLSEEYKKINENLVTHQQQLQKSTRRYQLLAENISDVIWVFNYSLDKFIYISPSVLQLRGYTVEEAMQLSFLDSLTPDSKEKIFQLIPIRLKRLKKGIVEEYRDELQQVRKDGRTIWVEMITSLRYADDDSIEVVGISKDIEILGMSRDITKRKLTEIEILERNKKLEESKERYQLLAENISDVIGVFNYTTGKYIYISPSILQLRGYTVEEAMKLSFLDSLTQESKDKLVKLIPVRVERFKKGIVEEYRDVLKQIRKDGTIIWVDILTKLRYAKDGSIEVQGVSRDITKQKLIESEILERNKILEKSKERYQLLAENISDVIWVFNYSSNKFVYVSPSVLQLRGYTVEEAMKLSFLDSLTQYSKEKIIKIIPTRLERFKNGIVEEYIDVLEQVKKDGVIVWVEMVTKMRYAKDGSIEVQGVSRNITKRKLIEIELIERNKKLFSLNKQLRESEGKYKALSENSALGIVVHNIKGEINIPIIKQ